MPKFRKLTVEQRDKIADKLMLLGNIVFSTMVIAPFISTQFNKSGVSVFIVGGITFAVIYSVAISIMRGGAIR